MSKQVRSVTPSPRSIAPAAAVAMLAAGVGGCQDGQAVGSLATPGLDTSPAVIGSMENAIIAAFASCKGRQHVRTHYVPQIKVTLDRDGAFAAPPLLVNPSEKRADRTAGAAALAAVDRCNPLTVVRSYRPYYPYWHEYILNFEPS